MRVFRLVRGNLVLVAAAMATAATAHDGWLEPSEYDPNPGTEFEISLQIGHEADRSRVELSPLPNWVRHAITINADDAGLVASIPGKEIGRELDLSLVASGTHLYALSTYAFYNELKAAEFNEYLRDEGLVAVLEHRRANGTSDLPGREIYHRVAKLIVGNSQLVSNPSVTKPIGMALEIVPACDPTAGSCRTSLPIQLLFYGIPVEGARVELNDLSSGQWPTVVKITNTEGSAKFDIPHEGEWMISAIWSRPVTGDERGDYETVFSSLAFANSATVLSKNSQPLSDVGK